MKAQFRETSNAQFRYHNGKFGTIKFEYGMIFFIMDDQRFVKTSTVEKISYKNINEENGTCEMVVTTLNSIYIFLIDKNNDGKIVL
ncbi:MAG: hypothetical protein L0Y61_06705 [Epsilonproteobacteria bacterium]|nr:hypothetical protein [Campylobacterota bacterium]